MKKIIKISELEQKAKELRIDMLKMLNQAGSGHTGGPLGLADIFSVLYFNVLNHNPKNPFWEKRDRLVLSAGHLCPIQYVSMAHCGYFLLRALSTLRKINSCLQGHPSHVDLPGIELSTASLGQGLGVAVGMALAAKLKKQNHKIYCITSDGEHDEGSTWEAINAAQKYRLNNLINIIDRNNIQISGYTHSVWPIEPLKERYLAHNWKVLEINGNDIPQILNAFKQAQASQQPVVIIAYTVPGKGVSFMEHKYEWHGKTPNDEELEKALRELR